MITNTYVHGFNKSCTFIVEVISRESSDRLTQVSQVCTNIKLLEVVLGWFDNSVTFTEETFFGLDVEKNFFYEKAW